jgi:hypothetical protein
MTIKEQRGGIKAESDRETGRKNRERKKRWSQTEKDIERQ